MHAVRILLTQVTYLNFSLAVATVLFLVHILILNFTDVHVYMHHMHNYGNYTWDKSPFILIFLSYQWLDKSCLIVYPLK